MTHGKLKASNLRVGETTIPPRNFGKHKEIAYIAQHGRNVTFTFSDASKMSVDANVIIPVGVSFAWPPLN